MKDSFRSSGCIVIVRRRIAIGASRLFLMAALAAAGGAISACSGSPATAVPVAVAPDTAANSARATIEAALVLAGGAPATPTILPVGPGDVTATPQSSPTDTPAPLLTETATSIATNPSTLLPTETATLLPTDTPSPSPSATATPVPTDTPTSWPTDIPTPTPNAGATATAQFAMLQAAVAATLTAQVTPTPTPDFPATQSAFMATAVAATLTAQATPTPTPDSASTRRAFMATAIAQTLTAQPTLTPTHRPTNTPPPVSTPVPRPTDTPWPTSTPVPPTPLPPTPVPPPPPNNSLANDLRARAQSSWVSSNFPSERDRFIDAVVAHLDEFQLPNLGITQDSMTNALYRGDANRVNGIVNQVWGNWMDDVRKRGLNVYGSDPGDAGLSPFRQLVIRLIQGRHGRLTDSQQHGLYSMFTRNEESHVWVDFLNGVIGAINRESFQWGK